MPKRNLTKKDMLVVGLIQINSSFSDTGYFPYSAGLMQAYYAKYGKNIPRVTFLETLFERCSVSVALQHFQGAHLVAFSTYAWNFQVSIAIAGALKKSFPGIVILFGGPQVPRDVQSFLQKYHFIDIVCHGEGERILTQVIDSLDSHDWSGIPSISYRYGEEIRTSSEFERFTELGQIPSPYLSGVFCSLMRSYPNRQWIGLWETNRGCPFSCTFCDWGAPEQRRVYQFPVERCKDELQWFAKNKIEFVFCCDANFGMFERDVELAAFAADLYHKYGYPKAISVQNAKNATERIIRVQNEFARGFLNKGVTLAMQSATPEVLVNINRKNISFRMFSDLQHYFTEKGIETYTDLILCLPGETCESFLSGVDTVIEGGQFNRIQFGNLSVLPNSQMAAPEYIARYGLETVDSNCINMHGQRDPEGEIIEKQQLIIASAAMPKETWRWTRAWAWMCSFLFFNKTLQIPLTMVHALEHIAISRLVSAFLVHDERFPLLSAITSFFEEEAGSVQNGGPEFFYSDEVLGIYWPHDEYCLIRLTVDEDWGVFYSECHAILSGQLAHDDWRAGDASPLHDAIRLNHAMMKTPSMEMNMVELKHNIFEYHQGIVTGKPVPLEKRAASYAIDKRTEWVDLDDWARRVVWWGNKKAAYWWPVTPQ